MQTENYSIFIASYLGASKQQLKQDMKMKKKTAETHTGGASLAVHVEHWIQRVGNPQCWADQGPIQNSTI